MWIVALLALFAQISSDSLPMIEKLIAGGQHREALAALNRLPVSTQWHLLASKAHDGLGDAKKAVGEAEAALALDPRSEAAHIQLGQIFLSNNTPQAALDVFTEALSLHPGSFLLRAGRGLALKDLNLYDEAERELRRCLDARPGFPICFDGLATVLLNAKRFTDLDRASVAQESHNPRDFRAPYFAAAASLALDGDVAAIESLLARSIQRNPKFAASHALLGRVQLQAGRIDSAMASLETAVRLRPNYAPALLNLAQAYKKAGREADAARAFEQLRQANDRERQAKPALIYHRGIK